MMHARVLPSGLRLGCMKTRKLSAECEQGHVGRARPGIVLLPRSLPCTRASAAAAAAAAAAVEVALHDGTVQLLANVRPPDA